MIREVRDESGDMVMPKGKEKEFKKGVEGENYSEMSCIKQSLLTEVVQNRNRRPWEIMQIVI